MPGRTGRMALMAIAMLVALPAVQARTLRAIEQTGSLRLCLAGSSAEFYRANGEALARYLGVAAEILYLKDWNAQFEDRNGKVVKEASYIARQLADGSCDVFPNDLHLLAWRQTKMALVPYYSTRNVVVVNQGLRSAIRSIDDLRGRRAAVQQGTAYDSWLLEQNAGRLAANPVAIAYYPTDDAMRAVDDGRAEFTVVGSESSVKWLRSDQVKLDMLFPVGQPVDVGWGIDPAADDLKARIEQFFVDNQRLGSDLDRAWFAHRNISLVEYRLLYDSFISSRPSVKTLLQWGIPAALAILAVFCFGVAWNRRLKREVGQRRIAEDRIIGLLDQQTRFFSFVAHELRSPLGVIVTGMANLRLGLSDASDGVRQRIARIERATHRMSALIDRHLRLQRLTRADFSLDLDDCPPSFPALAALELIAETHPARVIEKSIADDLPAAIRVDNDLLTLAIVNLLDNAIKYSPAQSPITLSVERAAPSRGEVVYRVCDRGLGIAAKDRPRLFSIYARQSDNINTGFGIGLALVANIARHHGGSVECASSDAGSTFTLRLPIDAERTSGANAA